MIHATDILKLLDTFERLKASTTLPNDTKKLIAGELLTQVPADIMAPGCKHTSEAVRTALKDYIKDDRHVGSASQEAARKTSKEPVAPGEAKEAGVRTQESAACEETMPTEVEHQVAGAGSGLRQHEPPEAALAGPGVASKEARGNTGGNRGRKASGRP